MGCSISKVQKYLEREGLTRTNLGSKRLLSKRNQHNSTFFDSIDAEEKAYWLGFFYADGYLDKDGSTLKLDLSPRDAVHLQRFANIFHREVRVYERNPDKRNGRVYSTASCTISCAYLWHALIEKGIKQGKSKDSILNVHHIESRKTGGDRPDNLITLCETCHDLLHRTHQEHKIPRKSGGFRDATQMGSMRWRIYNATIRKGGKRQRNTIVQKAHTCLVERRGGIPPTAELVGILPPQS